MKRSFSSFLNLEYLVLFGFFYFSLSFIVIRPTVGEFLTIFCIDTSIALAFAFFNKQMLIKINPSFKAIFDCNLEENLITASKSEKKEILDKLLSVPVTESKLTFFKLMLRAIVICALVNYFEYGSEYFFAKTTLFYGLLFIAFFSTYYSINNHCNEVIAGWIRKLHEKYDFSESIFEAKTQPSIEPNIEILGLVTIILSVLGLGLYYDYDNKTFSLEPVMMFGCFVVYIFAVYYILKRQSKKSFNLNLKYMSKQLEKTMIDGDPKPLALHPNAKIFNIDLFINQFINRLNNERFQVEKKFENHILESRIITMGELSQGVIHDLFTPLQNLKLCAEVLRRDPNTAYDPQFVNDLEESAKKAIEISQALRHYLSIPKVSDHRKFGDIFDNILIILKSKYPKYRLADVFVVNKEIMNETLYIHGTFALHILFNLLNFYMQNLSDKKQVNPKIQLELKTSEKGNQKFSISEASTVMDEKYFNQLISLSNMEAEAKLKGDLGLWLSSRIIAKCNGSLNLVNNSIVWNVNYMETM